MNWLPKSATASAANLAEGYPELEQAVQRSKKILHKKALMAAVASSVPIPGLDWAADAALLTKLIPQINREFGLSPEQIDALHPEKREQVQRAVAMVGSVLIGKLITREMVVKLATTIGVRMSSKQAAKFVPFAGQAISATIGYAALRYLGEQHLRECVEVAKQAQLPLPATHSK
ncbi:hypothetical protein E9531_07145 [Lampropedia puyangensis]|uniref:DUF697 domain-containing protein n=1 Tax=Lampropedia puyangensis TaxID=1330072 RepID=A0A4S8F5Z4_9BURK|nr:hypothetical protein [Lampropedia puyangensis]THU02863.1 hypothetical protein E9531_07145 [Lampropedia puyangensis]